jgi:hypothetical protein
MMGAEVSLHVRYMQVKLYSVDFLSFSEISPSGFTILFLTPGHHGIQLTTGESSNASALRP